MTGRSPGGSPTRCRCASFSARGLDETTPDHSTISRTRRLYWLSTHQAVFKWVLKRLAKKGLVRGERVSVDATTLEGMRRVLAAAVNRTLLAG